MLHASAVLRYSCQLFSSAQEGEGETAGRASSLAHMVCILDPLETGRKSSLNNSDQWAGRGSRCLGESQLRGQGEPPSRDPPGPGYYIMVILFPHVLETRQHKKVAEALVIRTHMDW